MIPLFWLRLHVSYILVMSYITFVILLFCAFMPA